tara:strand:+ start:258 stop:449 length:192 start_codon:yes stop_codon:yes gene_type:complete
MENPNQQYFDFLDGVRDSGEHNMYAAPSLLRDAFGLDKRTAQIIGLEWMRSYDKQQETCQTTT